MKFLLRSGILHMLAMCLLFTILCISMAVAGTFDPGVWLDLDPYEMYGKWPTILLYTLRVMTLVSLPLVIGNFLGFVMFNTFPEKQTPKTSPLFAPFICFRVVTRGTYPNLVKTNVRRNIAICSDVGLVNFIVEVVTDTAINIPPSARIREVVVPTHYRSANGSLYKARALQYCLESHVNDLADNDWIVHLDEETLLTNSSAIGIINFINEGLYSFGQGVITYANEEIVCWITTIADLNRVGIDYGLLRYALNYLHKPVFGWKGSYIVANVGAEKKVTFDFGTEGSMTEDCFFALSAWRDGYTFGFVEGEMWEKSTFSPMDFIRQRKRWMQGIMLVMLSRKIPARNKVGISVIFLSSVSMLVTIPNLVLIPLYPLPMPTIMNFLFGFASGIVLFTFGIGAVKSFDYRRRGLAMFIFLCVSLVLLMPVCLVLEACGPAWALVSQTKGFYITKKEIRPSLIDV